jgi:hypothetical protein
MLITNDDAPAGRAENTHGGLALKLTEIRRLAQTQVKKPVVPRSASGTT